MNPRTARAHLAGDARPGVAARRHNAGVVVLATALIAIGMAAPATPAQSPAKPGSVDGTRLRIGASGVLLGTHASPVFAGDDDTEPYLTQPVVLAMLDAAGGRLRVMGMLNLEGWTLEDGEMNPGVWGEGFVDRRHPHTFLHELVATWTTSFAGLDASLTVGRGFAPFGTDDPMVRPFVKYPVNHHLAQLLERWTAILAVQRGPVVLEGGMFNGDEPIGPESLGEIDRFGDSWAARATLRPMAGVELQASHAYVESPEHAHGRGLDHRKWSSSVRYERRTGANDAYALFEWARTDEFSDDHRAFAFSTWLGEVALARNGWTAAARWERSTRPEEERLFDPFRTARPHADENINGATRWITWTGRLERQLRTAPVDFTPFIEASHMSVREITGAIFSPAEFYGDDRLWSVSLGIRIGAGARHARMGRYGVAVPVTTAHH